MKFAKLFYLLAFLVLSGCGLVMPKHYRIGFDPTWYPQDFGNQTSNIEGFTRSLIADIGDAEHFKPELVVSDPLSLDRNLKEGNYEAVLTTLTPNLANLELYDFSDPFLLTGPVLVLPIQDKVTSLDDLKYKIVGIYQFDQTVQLAETFPSLMIQNYENMAIALEALAGGEIDAVLMNVLEATALVNSQYSGVLWIASPPLTESGLRLATLKGRSSRLVDRFNQGLKTLQTQGAYAKLRAKFSIN